MRLGSRVRMLCPRVKFLQNIYNDVDLIKKQYKMAKWKPLWMHLKQYCFSTIVKKIMWKFQNMFNGWSVTHKALLNGL